MPKLPRYSDNCDILTCDVTIWYPWLPGRNGYGRTWFVCDVTTWVPVEIGIPSLMTELRLPVALTPRIQLGSWFPCLRQSFVCERRYKPDWNYYGKN